LKKPNEKKYAGKTREEWRNWGERFGKRLEIGGRNVEEELEKLSRDLRQEMKRKGKRIEVKCKTVFLGTFGLIGPLIGSVFGLILLALGIWFLNLINVNLHNEFILLLSAFLSTNLPWFFGAMLFFSYSKYFARGYPEIYWLFSPLVTSVGLVIFVWIIAWMLNIINLFTHNATVESASFFLYENLLKIFILFLVLAYVIMIVWKSVAKERFR